MHEKGKRGTPKSSEEVTMPSSMDLGFRNSLPLQTILFKNSRSRSITHHSSHWHGFSAASFQSAAHDVFCKNSSGIECVCVRGCKFDFLFRERQDLLCAKMQSGKIPSRA